MKENDQMTRPLPYETDPISYDFLCALHERIKRPDYDYKRLSEEADYLYWKMEQSGMDKEAVEAYRMAEIQYRIKLEAMLQAHKMAREALDATAKTHKIKIVKYPLWGWHKHRKSG